VVDQWVSNVESSLPRDFLNGFGSFDNGQVYAYLIASGQNVFSLFTDPLLRQEPDNTRGAGPLKLLLGGVVYLGKIEISSSEATEINIPFSVRSGDRRIDAAIWWPQTPAPGQGQGTILIQLVDPSNMGRTISGPIGNPFARTRFDESPLPVGDWTLHIVSTQLLVVPQTVYFVIHSTPFTPITPLSDECVVTSVINVLSD
jgi:serine protease AprX